MKRILWGVAIFCVCLACHTGVAWAEDDVPQPPGPPEGVPVEQPPILVPESGHPAPPPPGEGFIVQPPDGGVVVLPPAPPPDNAWQPSPVRPAPRLRRNVTPPWRLNIQGGFSILDEPEGTLGNPPAGQPPITWDNNDYTPALGGRVTLARTLCDAEFEFRGTYYGGWEDDSRQTGSFGFANVFGQSPNASATLLSEADVISLEANYWRDFQSCGPRLRWGVGLRYINFEEQATASNWVGLAPNSFLSGEAENEFIGAQVMLAANWEAIERVTVELAGRAFFGSMGRDVIIDETSILSGGSKRATDEASEFGWGFEINLDAWFKVNNCLYITAGYSALYLDEVQRAHDALDFSQGNTGAVQAQQVTDSVWVHSLWLGLEFRF